MARRGAAIADANHRRANRGDGGFTLVEMLIVLAILAVAAGGVALGMGSVTRPASVETEARQLATRLQAAADDAMLGDRTIAFTVQRHGYGFATYTPQGLVPLDSKALGFHPLPGGMTLNLSVAAPVVLGVDGAGRPMSATIASGDQRWIVSYDGMTATAVPAPAT
ncbi:MAG: prepilin-type N-terminal cleavage/methylation domain-containing protein [Pseudomonadota bacterium]